MLHDSLAKQRREQSCGISAPGRPTKPSQYSEADHRAWKEDNPRDATAPEGRNGGRRSLAAMDEGEKSLIFCFRVPTAETLYRILSRGVERRLRAARNALFASRGTETGGDFDADKAMQQFRRSLTGPRRIGCPAIPRPGVARMADEHRI